MVYLLFTIASITFSATDGVMYLHSISSYSSKISLETHNLYFPLRKLPKRFCRYFYWVVSVLSSSCREQLFWRSLFVGCAKVHFAYLIEFFLVEYACFP